MAWILETGYLTIIRPFIHSVYGFKIGNQINSLFLIGFALVFLFIIVGANFLIPIYGWPIIFYIQGFLTFISLVIVCIRKEDFKEIENGDINYKNIYITQRTQLRK
jgi:uncharacterized membrane protein